jgi:predicted nuclease with TOPRIM domain
MRRRTLVALLGVLALALSSAWGLAGEAPEPEKKNAPAAEKAEKRVDPYRSLISKLTAARRDTIQGNAELKTAYEGIQTKRKELDKELEALYAKVAAANPAVAELEKQKAAMEEERRKAEEAKRPKREKRPKGEEKAPEKAPEEKK